MVKIYVAKTQYHRKCARFCTIIAHISSLIPNNVSRETISSKQNIFHYSISLIPDV